MEEVPSVAIEVKERTKLPFLLDVLVRLIKEKPLGTVGAIIVLIMFLLGILANVVSPYGYNELHLDARLAPPSATYILGTDNLGRDLLSRIIYGARISLYVGLGGSALELILGFFIGALSGYFGGKFDMFMQRFVDAFMAFPALVLYLTVVALIGPGLIQVVLLLGISGGIRASRTIRSAVIGIRENVYVSASRAIGASDAHILAQHIIPNIMAPAIVIGTTAIGRMILQESTLSFLGFGIPPPTPSWGSMLSWGGRTYMLQAPWMALWPGVALSLAVYGVNMLGDGLRDILDPRLRGGLGRYGRKETKLKK